MKFSHFVPEPIRLIYLSRIDLQSCYDLNSPIGVVSFYIWWKQHAEKTEYRLIWFPSQAFLNFLISNDTSRQLPLLAESILLDRPDLQTAFGSSSSIDISSLFNWFSNSFPLEYFFVHNLSFLPVSDFSSNNPWFFLAPASNTFVSDPTFQHIYESSRVYEYMHLFFRSQLSFESIQSKLSPCPNHYPDIRI